MREIVGQRGTAWDSVGQRGAAWGRVTTVQAYRPHTNRVTAGQRTTLSQESKCRK